MKRILIFAGYFYPHIGGYEKNIGELARRLIAKGYQVDILTSNSNHAPAIEQHDGINIYRIPCWDALGGNFPIPQPTPVFFKIFRLLWHNRYDMINTQTRFFLTSLLGLVFARLKSTALVHTERGSRHSALANKLVESISTIYDHTIGSLIVGSAKVNIGVSEAAGDFLNHLGARNTRIIPNGIDTDIYRKNGSISKEIFGLSPDDIVITFTGRLIHGKGVQDLIAVMPEISAVDSRIHLLIAGGGSYKPALEELSRTSGCGNQIKFLGQQDSQHLITLLRATDLFVNPSYSEGLPTSVMEAASMGLPIIATDVGGTREIIKDRETGLLVKHGDTSALAQSLKTLVKDRTLRNALAKNARDFVSTKFDWGQVIQEYCGIIAQCSHSKKK